MTGNIADCIRCGLEESLAYAFGTADASIYGAHIPKNIDAKAIRSRLSLTHSRHAAGKSACTPVCLGAVKAAR